VDYLRQKSLGLVLAATFALVGMTGEAQAQARAVIAERVYTAPDKPPLEDAVILIRDGVIEKLGSRHSTAIPDDYEVFDWAGFTLTAGFWNSHVHLVTPTYLRAELASDEEIQGELERTFTRWGFTTVFDLASTTEVAAEIAGRLAGGRIVGPRVLSVREPFYPEAATPIYARPFYEAFDLPSAEVATAVEAADRARRQLREGAEGVKLFAGSIVGGEDDVAIMPPAIIAAISREAERARRPVFAHPTNQAGLEAAVENGVNVLAHAVPLMGPWSPEYAKQIAARGVALVPTLALFELDPHPSTPVAHAIQQTSAFRDAGGAVLFGTDAGFSDVFDTSTELRLLGSAIGWQAVLEALTTAPAAHFGEAQLRGQIAPGFLADIVALAGDPADEITRLADVRRVMVAGRVVFDKGGATDASR